MTVTVTLSHGGSIAYMRPRDAYIKHRDGTLYVVRAGERSRHRYASGQWAHVMGDERATPARRFWS